MTIGEIAEAVTAISALGALVMSAWNSRKIQEVHLSINSRMDALLQTTKLEAHAAGVQQERDTRRDA